MSKAHRIKISALLGAVILSLGLVQVTQTLVEPRYRTAVTDFGRDLIGAKAVSLGQSPYQRLGQIEAVVPGLVVPVVFKEEWVAHSPLSIAMARLALWLFGEAAEEVARGVLVASVVALLALISLWDSNVSTLGARMAMAGSLALSVGLEDDILWLQGAALLALLIFVVLQLSRATQRWVALVLLGFCIAWKPWCAPLALALPGSSSRLRDLMRSGAIATAGTLLVLPWVGGVSSFRDWVAEALPQNATAYLNYEWNISLMGRRIVLLALVTALAVFLLYRSRDRHVSRPLPPRVGALAILGLLPMVWTHYWVGVSPALLPASERDAWWLTAAFLCMASPIIGGNAIAVRIGSGLALGLVALRTYARNSPRVPARPRHPEPAVFC